MVKLRPVARWRVAVTRDDKGEGSVSAALERAGCVPIAVPVLIEGPAPDPRRLHDLAAHLERFDWIICASVRAVGAIARARGSRWPSQPRTAAVGAVTAAAMRDAGSAEAIVADTFTAGALLEKLDGLDSWRDRTVLITTVAGGRRDLIDGLRARGASVTEIEPYTMTARPAGDIRHDWNTAAPDAVILGSAETARRLVDAVGLAPLRDLQAIVPIGPTTAAVLDGAGLRHALPDQATFASAVAKLISVLPP
jgi:uroporphyrinogen-III synthase